ncbi:MAG: hypothetical protein IT196_22270, partial [Acidimicrobiales bacterium]|nr:hypothetical protein [Acidimicrobiales bacterium]
AAAGPTGIVELASTIPKGMDRARSPLVDAPLPAPARPPITDRPAPPRADAVTVTPRAAPGATAAPGAPADLAGGQAALVPPSGALDSGWIARRLLVALDGGEASEHQQLYRAVGALHPEALARLAGVEGAVAGVGADRAGDPGQRLAEGVLRELLDASQYAPAASLADVMVRDFARRHGPDDPRTVAVLDQLLTAHRQLDALQLNDLLQRNTRLARTVANALGAGHPAAHSTEGHLSRLRSMWARHRQFGGQER